MTAPSDDLALAVGNALSGLAPLKEDLGTEQHLCEEHGEFTSTGTRYMGKRVVWTRCKACVDAEASEERKLAALVAAEQKRAGLEEMLSQTCMPRRFIGKTFDGYVAESAAQMRALELCRAFADRFDNVLRRGQSLILSGGVGTGKSHLAGAIMQAILPKHVGVYVTMLDLIRMLRETWRPGASHSESEVLSRLASVPLLVVDEVGLQYDTDGERTLFTDIMDRRYRNLMPVILLTNLTPPEFKATVGDRVHSRLSEVATWIAFDWPDYRSVARKAASNAAH